LQEPEKYHGTHLHHFMALDGEATMACIACIDILLIALHKTEAVVVTLSPKTQTTGTLKKCEDKHAKPKCRRHLRINERPMESHQETNKEELLQCSAESAVPH